MKPKRQLVPPVTWIVGGTTILILVAILLIPISERSHGPGYQRIVDGSNLRQIGQAALVYTLENNDRLPETNLGPDGIPVEGQTTAVHRYALALARNGRLNDLVVYISSQDTHPGVDHDLTQSTIVPEENIQEFAINPAFLESGISYQLVGGLTLDLPSTTPIAFTRGLREDGRWDSDNGVYGSEGGHIVYLGGNLIWHEDLTSEGNRLESLSGEPTENILETISPEQAVYGDPAPPIPDGTRGTGTWAETTAD